MLYLLLTFNDSVKQKGLFELRPLLYTREFAFPSALLFTL